MERKAEQGAPSARFSPGPWKVRDGQDIRRPHNILSHSGALVALAYWDSDLMEDSDEPEANAQLIAAAPELYEALRAMLASNEELNAPLAPEHVGRGWTARRAELERREAAALALTRSALAKAEGAAK